jgi:type IV secretory pathway component VirB8
MSKEVIEKLNHPFYGTWWAARTTSIVLIVLVFVVLAQASVIVWLTPLKEVKHVLLTAYDKDTQVVKVEPIEKTLYGWNKLMEIYSKQFVIDLHTVDGLTEKDRLKKLSLMASDEVEDFIENQLNFENPNALSRKIFDSGVVRSVRIKRVTSLAPDAPNTWQVEWELVELEPNANVQRSTHYISTIMAEGQTKIFNSTEEDLNPIGYTVIKYSLRMANV